MKQLTEDQRKRELARKSRYLKNVNIKLEGRRVTIVEYIEASICKYDGYSSSLVSLEQSKEVVDELKKKLAELTSKTD